MSRIRILWVDDRPRGGGLPESKLPVEFREYFQIVDPRPRDDDEYSSDYAFPSAVHFIPHLHQFWKNQKRNLLPCEILVTDYDLTRSAKGSDDGDSVSLGNDLFVADVVAKGCEHKEQREETASEVSDERDHDDGVNYDGLIINTLYSCLTHKHPSSLVSTTSYLSRMPSGVRTLQTLAEPFVGARFEQNLGGLERSWENILRVGLPHLRRRIEDLYKEGDIIIPPSDLTKMAEGDSDGDVRIRSPHGLRTLPVHGLFFFNDDNPREWAARLLKSKITLERYVSAEKLAKTMWCNYNDDVLMEEHAKFSMLHAEDQSNLEYKDLKTKFGLVKTGRGGNTYECTALCSDIRSVKVSCGTREDERNVRRWAALFLMRRLLKRILLFIDATKMGSISRHGEQRKGTQSLSPTFEEDDILLLLYPVPTSPVPLPWHIVDAKIRDNKKGAWRKWMGDNLDFTPKDILDGSGPTTGERQILQGMAMDDDVEFGDNPETRLERWKSYEPARLFLFGAGTSVERNKDE